MCVRFVVAFLLVALPAAANRAETIELRLPETEAAAGSQVDVAVELEGSKRMVAWQFVITHDPDLLRVAEVTVGDLLEGASVETNYDTPGRIAVAGARFQPVAEDGEMLRVTFDVVGADGDRSPLAIESAEAWQENEAEILVETAPGALTIGAAASGLWTALLKWWPYALGAGILLLGVIVGALLRGRGHAHVNEHSHELHEHDVEMPSNGKIHLKCPHCGRGLAAPPNAAGHTAKCAKCGKPLVIPPMAEVV